MTSLQPLNDPDTVQMKSGAQAILARATEIRVLDAASCAVAGDIGVRATEILKAVEKRRKFFVDPLNKHVKEINALFKGISEPVQEAADGLRQKIAAYRVEEKRLADEALRAAQAEAAEKARAAAEAAQEHAAAVDAPPPVAVEAEIKAEVAHDEAAMASAKAAILAVSGQPAKTTETATGRTTASKVWTHEVVCKELVPMEYLVVDETAIRRAVAAGERSIPGVRIYETERISFGGRR